MGERVRDFISAEEVAGMVERMAGEIARDFSESDICFVTVLDGALPFSRDLIAATYGESAVKNHFVRLKSYEGTGSTGDVRVLRDLEHSLDSKMAIVVEDIVDSGRTMKFLRGHLVERWGAGDVKIASLLSKPSRRVCEVKIDYLGREIPDEFVVGYGMDFEDEYRGLKFIGILEQD